jgi:hypothetical protein
VGATISTISNVLKEFYLGPVRDQLNSKVLALNLLQVSNENLEGLEAVLPLHTNRSSGVGARAELGVLPPAGNQPFAQAKFNLKYHYGRVQVSGQSIQRSASDAGSFLRAMKAELDMIKDDLAVDFARQVYGDGTGQIAICGASGPSTTVTLASAEAIKKGFLHVGMIVDISATATGTPVAQGNAVQITAVNPATPSITVGPSSVAGGGTGSVTVTGANAVYRYGNVTTGPVVSEMDAGLQAILSTSANTVGTINAASAGNEYWDNLRDSTGGAITLNGATGPILVNLNRANSAGADNLLFVTTPGLIRRLFGSADFNGAGTGNVRFVNTKQFAGGYSSISVDVGSGPIELASDRHAPWAKAFIIDRDHIKLFTPGDWDFMQRDGLTIRSMGVGATAIDAYEAVLYRYANLGTDRRNSSVVMSGLTDTDGN